MTKILVIDDLQINLLASKELLTNAFPDVQIITAQSGKEGIKKALEEVPDVILVDLLMPIMDGIETCKRLKEYDSLLLIPLIMITASDPDSKTRTKALQNGVISFLTKPLDSNELVAQLSSAIRYKNDANRCLLENKQGKNHEKLQINELELELKRAYMALDQCPVSVLITDIKGDIVYCNPEVSKLTGYPVKELYGQNPRIFQSGETLKEVYQNMWETILSGKEWHGEFHNKKRNGEFYWERVLISPIFHPDGSIINFLAVKEDITQWKRMKDEIKESKKHARESDVLKSAFFNNINHEIRTPMNAILGFANLLKNSETKCPEQKEYINIIEESGYTLLDTIDELVKMALIEAGQTKVSMSAINLNEEIKSIHKFFISKNENTGMEFLCKTQLSDEEAMIISDSGKLNYILVHLVENAIKYSHHGKIELGYSKKGADLEFYVRDNGIGITEKQKKIIFEKFRQGNETITNGFRGIGLGLTISKAFVEILGGRIWVESEKGKGSKFYFTIPYNNSGWEKAVVNTNIKSLRKKMMIKISTS